MRALCMWRFVNSAKDAKHCRIQLLHMCVISCCLPTITCLLHLEHVNDSSILLNFLAETAKMAHTATSGWLDGTDTSLPTVSVHTAARSTTWLCTSSNTPASKAGSWTCKPGRNVW